MTNVTAQMKLEDIMLSEKSQSQKDKYHTSPLMRHLVVKFTETESKMVVTRAWRGVGGGAGKRGIYCLMGTVFIWKSSGDGRW